MINSIVLISHIRFTYDCFVSCMYKALLWKEKGDFVLSGFYERIYVLLKIYSTEQYKISKITTSQE